MARALNPNKSQPESFTGLSVHIAEEREGQAMCRSEALVRGDIIIADADNDRVQPGEFGVPVAEGARLLGAYWCIVLWVEVHDHRAFTEQAESLKKSLFWSDSSTSGAWSPIFSIVMVLSDPLLGERKLTGMKPLLSRP